MTRYKAVRNTVVDAETGAQVAVIVPTNCTQKLAREMAAYAERNRVRAVTQEATT